MLNGRQRQALVIGGGIAGPVAAMALQRVGIKATVYEARDEPAEHDGLFLNLASNGLEALRALDIDVASRADGVPIPRMVMWNGQGKRLGEVANGLSRTGGCVSVCVGRGLLQRVLREEAERRGIQIVNGKRLQGYELSDDGRIVAHFADLTQAEGDLLLGADGVHSCTRLLMDPTAPAPSYTGLLSIGGYSLDAAVSPTPDTQHFVFGKHAFFGYLVHEDHQAYWFANLPRADGPLRGELETMTDSAWQALLLDTFDDDSDVIAQILRTAVGPIGAYPIYDLPTLPAWHRGPVALLGDAAHAVSPNAGQGASLACEDALVVATCLRDDPDTAAALVAYEGLRRERAEKVVAYSRKIGGAKVAGPFARRVRDLAMPFALKHFASPKAHAWMYDYRVDFEGAA